MMQTTNEALVNSRDRLIARGLNHQHPIFVRSARGARLTDVGGREYIDLTSGIGVNNLGHNHPAVVDAVTRQAGALMHSCFQVGMYESYLEVAERLHRLSPGQFEKKTFLANSGAEAIEGAVKFARAFTKRDAILTFQYSFHGRTFYALRMTGRAKPYRAGFGSLGGEVARLPYPYAYRMTAGDAEACAEQVLARLEELFLTELPPEAFAAIVFEPILGEGGIVVPPKGLFRRIAERCREAGIVVIADEVQTGIGRTGCFAASEALEVDADLMVFAKSLGFGLPLAAVTGRAEIIDALAPGGLGGTLGGNPVACAAAIAGLDALQTEGVMHKAKDSGQQAIKKLKSIQQGCELVGDVRGLGLMIGIELVSDRKTRKPAVAETRRVAEKCRERGVLVLYGGAFGNVIRMLPPLTIGNSELEQALETLKEVLNDASS
jgi:4-aminobutyrate aminotransferase/(S)-3-amino-2-methylpropionate transaminase